MSETGGETLPPPQSLRDDLDDLFSAVLFEYLGQEDKELPEHLAAAFLTGDEHGIEVLVIGNWKTRQRIEIARACLDSQNAEFMSKSVDDDDTGKVEYKITVSNLMRTLIPIEFADGTEAETMERRYEVFPDKIKFWAISTDDEGDDIIYMTDAEQGTELFDEFREYLLHGAGHEDLLGTFELSPETIIGDS